MPRRHEPLQSYAPTSRGAHYHFRHAPRCAHDNAMLATPPELFDPGCALAFPRPLSDAAELRAGLPSTAAWPAYPVA